MEKVSSKDFLLNWTNGSLGVIPTVIMVWLLPHLIDLLKENRWLEFALCLIGYGLTSVLLGAQKNIYADDKGLYLKTEFYEIQLKDPVYIPYEQIKSLLIDQPDDFKDYQLLIELRNGSNMLLQSEYLKSVLIKQTQWVNTYMQSIPKKIGKSLYEKQY